LFRSKPVPFLSMVPVLLRKAGYDFRFRAKDAGEPPHVHIRGNGGVAKIWLRSLRIAKRRGYSRRHIDEIRRITERHQAEWLAAWSRFFA
jgi:hypothetical protein